MAELLAFGHDAKNMTVTSVTAAEKVLKGCTAGKSTLIGWAVCDAKTGGNVIEWGTLTSTEVSTTATPPKIAAEALIYELK